VPPGVGRVFRRRVGGRIFVPFLRGLVLERGGEKCRLSLNRCD
jgi:hypothetical protein